ncbi:hypothetical protein V1264_011959 [Littorina saxatilis]|uniref:Reticulon-like protein n=2 Tax=Littorina saxatilis TaxID=31220 RepID=A0AAN9BTX8_9CAEN
MADLSDIAVSETPSEESIARRELYELKRDLEGWREALVTLKDLLTWKKQYYPAIIFGVTTFIFALIWLLQPSVMTTFAVLGLLLTATDFTVPLVGRYIFSYGQWTGTEERQFEDLCEGILHSRILISKFVRGLTRLKQERPTVYFVMLMAMLAFFAWMGSFMNNLFLTYFFVLAVLMIPGLQQKGLLQKYLLQYWLIFKRLAFGDLQTTDKKSN